MKLILTPLRVYTRKRQNLVATNVTTDLISPSRGLGLVVNSQGPFKF